MSEINYSTKTTDEQYRIYLAALESDSYFRAIENHITDPLSLVADCYLKNKWIKLSRKLNSEKGPKRAWKDWQKNFSDWKHDTRKRYLKMIQELSVLEAKVLYLTGSSKLTNLKNVNLGKLLNCEDTEEFETTNNGNDMENVKLEYVSNPEIKTEYLFETNCTTEILYNENREVNIRAKKRSRNRANKANKANIAKRIKKPRLKKRESMQTRTLELKTIHFDKDRKDIKVYQNKKKLLQSHLSTPTPTEENKNTTQLKKLSVPNNLRRVINGNLKLLSSQTIGKNPQENIIRQTYKTKTDVKPFQIEPTQQKVKKIDLKIINISHNVPKIKCENSPDYNDANCDFSFKFDTDIKKEEMSE